MALSKISDIRRSELRQAAFAVMQREGASATTLEKVAKEAGASKSIVLHYFRNKQELFEEAMREGNANLRLAVVKRLNTAASPFQRIWAVVEANLSEEFFSPPNGNAWLSLCAEAPKAPRLARLQTIIHARMHSNLLSGLRPLVPEAEAQKIAVTLSALIDGFWVRLALGDKSLTSRMALQLAYGHLAAVLPSTSLEDVMSAEPEESLGS
ncbi:choline-binding transcriptional repressor BetI [Roseobacteraceae bacterium NS-SX3]